MADAAKKGTEAPKDTTKKAETVRKDYLGVVLLVLVAVNLAGLGGLGYLLKNMWSKMQTAQQQAPVTAASGHEDKIPLGKELEPQSLGVMYPMESFLVNIASDQGTKFFQVQLELELADPSVEDEVSRKKAALRDSIIVLLSSRSYKQLREPNGIKALRKDLLRAINQNLTAGQVKDIFFTQFHFN